MKHRTITVKTLDNKKPEDIIEELYLVLLAQKRAGKPVTRELSIVSEAMDKLRSLVTPIVID